MSAAVAVNLEHLMLCRLLTAMYRTLVASTSRRSLVPTLP